LDAFIHANDQSFAKLQYTVKGIKRSQSVQKLLHQPVTIPMLHQFLLILKHGLFGMYIDTMLSCVFKLAFFVFLRCGEFTAPNAQFDSHVGLTRQDVSLFYTEGQPCIRLHLKSSKTDPFKLGVTIQVHATGNNLCPVNALNAYLKIRDHLTTTPSYPLFVLPNFTPLTRQKFTYYLDSVLNICNIPVNTVRPHSFRIGAATAAAAAGVPDHVIKILGRWKSSSYQLYIHTPLALISAAQVKMSQQ
jgi:integrase